MFVVNGIGFASFKVPALDYVGCPNVTVTCHPVSDN